MFFKNSLIYITKAIAFGLIMATVVIVLSSSLGQKLKINEWFGRENVSERLSFAKAVRKSAPAVVNIYSINIVPARGSSSKTLQSRSRLQGLGSGVIMRKDGLILTNYHVIQKADEIAVLLQDGQQFEAEIIGMDPATDLAVLKVNGTNLPVIKFDVKSMPQVGDVALAIGNPYNLGQTITQGIISATGRAGLSAGYQEFLQTDAAINAGNSGGALIDTKGNLIGINTAAFRVRGENEQSLGFAIPIKLAYDVMSKLVKYGRVIRGEIGFNGGAVAANPKLAQILRLPDLSGVLIQGVDRNSSAYSHLMVNDVVIAYNGEKIPTGVQGTWMLRDRIAESKPGSKAKITFIRNGKEMTTEVNVTEKPTLPLNVR
ncbi:trypsin-like peptidase domain-containing protein [Shewanella sp. 202IG2-18]|uniref:trypsin-like peptidase domain-containing protein n=1 Tax=Parashewanella hymeniacidonis TaxID=2807618 RepID=UPI00196044E8|nr:trypsin-like peptidase domain-containing protein [Parashewanella hymeniacidonis]MBM7071163.1 trypsin-like peptidase domain-containing protein [Parashewanella hymeniacidonis]